MHRMYALCLMALTLAPGDGRAAGICKWVDANGVTHYAESCPQDQAGTPVEIEPPPPPERADEADRRYEQLRARQQARREREREAAEFHAGERAASEQQARVDNGLCVRARRNLGVLEYQAPVYYDEQGWLQHNDSIHSRHYAGARRYVEDADRPARQRHYQSQIDRHCGKSEADIRQQVELMVAETNRQVRCASLLELGYRLDGAGIVSRDPENNAEWFRNNCR